MELILRGSISKTVLLLAFPTLMMSLVQSLLPLTDGLYINNYSGSISASAVTYGEPVINLVIGIAQGLGVAAMALIGQTNGRGEYENARRMAVQITAFTMLLSFIAVPLLIGAAFPISWHVTQEISAGVFRYLALYSAVLPFAFFQTAFNAIRNAMGHPEDTFIPALLLLAFKTLFNYVFIAWLGLDIFGCVLASWISELLISLWMFYVLFLKKGPERLRLKGFRFERELTAVLVRLGIPTMLSNLTMSLGIFLINNDVQKYGAVVLNGAGIASNITGVCFIVPAAFGAAVTTMVSMNIGAGQPEKAKHACTAASGMSIVTSFIMIAFLMSLGNVLTGCFTRNPEVLAVAVPALHTYAFSIIGFAVCQVQLGAFVGMGRTRMPLLIGFLRIWLIRMIFIWFTEPTLGVYAVFWGNLFSNSVAAVLTTAMVLRTRWRSVI